MMLLRFSFLALEKAARRKLRETGVGVGTSR